MPFLRSRRRTSTEHRQQHADRQNPSSPPILLLFPPLHRATKDPAKPTAFPLKKTGKSLGISPSFLALEHT
ncbi:hypothetical protein SLEP1_g47588 [Rubroshorea leprosula]|uniref:Uncharacterized protein n=1 Tax=Rubroshorea leprosula TaxID=152421 RepID=A0AAV5LRT8_9ROSI|nr:hypothetical protein SLEP1_g47588 [Rubroshorea leprosula]